MVIYYSILGLSYVGHYALFYGHTNFSETYLTFVYVGLRIGPQWINGLSAERLSTPR